VTVSAAKGNDKLEAFKDGVYTFQNFDAVF